MVLLSIGVCSGWIGMSAEIAEIFISAIKFWGAAAFTIGSFKIIVFLIELNKNWACPSVIS